MERIHVAAFPWIGSGHVNPIVELSRRLIPLGFSVKIILTEDYYTKLCMTLQEEHIELVSIPKPENFPIDPPVAVKESVEQALKSLNVPVKCLISDWFMGWTQDLANDLGIPRVAVVTCSARTEVICFHIPRLISEGFIPANAKPEDNTLITYLPGIEPLQRKQLPLTFHEWSTTIEPLGRSVERLKEAACVLVNTVEELEQEIVDARRAEFKYLPMGPLVPSEFLSDEDAARSKARLRESELSILSWLDKHPQHKVLYIAFGSVVRLPVEQVEKIALAVKASKQPFVWAIRRNFATDARENFFEELVKRFDDQGLVVEWAPQVHVLRHKSVGAFFTHCGWNSTMESVCAGVPMICWPCAAEQNLNAKAMVDKWKIGKKVAEGPKTEVTVEDIEGVIRAVMDGCGTDLRGRTKELMQIVRGAFRGGSSEKNLLSFKEIASCF